MFTRFTLLFALIAFCGKDLRAQFMNTIGGTGTAGYNNDGISAVLSQINNPAGIALDTFGNLYVADRANHRIRKISGTGTITTVAGTGTMGFSGDGSAATAAQLNNPAGVWVDYDGTLYISDAGNNRVRRINTSGVINTIVGTGTGGYNGDNVQANTAQLNNPGGLCLDNNGNLYIADVGNHRVRKINSSNVITTVAGTGTGGYGGDGSVATSAQLNNPQDVVYSLATNGLYIADYGNNRVRLLDLFTGNITTFAGTGTAGYSGDYDVATSAMLNGPIRLSTDGQSIYISDRNNNRIRKVQLSPPQVILPVAGNGLVTYNGENILPLSGGLNLPVGVAVSKNGAVYIADAGNHRIRLATNNWYRDDDKDGFGKPGTLRSGLTPQTGFVNNSMDCNDSSVNAAEWYYMGQQAFTKGAVSFQSMAIDKDGFPIVVYKDATQSNKASVMNCAGGAWNLVGSEGFTASAVDYPDIAVNSQNEPVIAFSMGPNGLNVMKYDGSAWNTVGSNSGAPVSNISLAIDRRDRPTIAFQWASNSDIAVWYYGPTTSMYSGTIGKSGGPLSLAIDGAGTPYVAFIDADNGNKATVKKWKPGSPTNWETVGTVGFSSAAISHIDLHIDMYGVPFVAMEDAATSKGTVMMLNGNTWVTIGSPGVTPGTADYITIAADANRNLHIAYRDGNNNNKITVMKLQGAGMVPVGVAGFSSTAANDYTGIAFDRKGIPFAMYKEASNNKLSVMTISMKPSLPSKPIFSGTTTVCAGTPTVIEITGSSALNDAATWQWFTGSCGGTKLSTNKSIAVAPTVKTTYYARAEGPCLVTPGDCDSIVVTPDPILQHIVTLSGGPDTNIWVNDLPVTLTANTTNSGTNPVFEWYKNGQLIAGATTATYNAGPVKENDNFCVNVTSDAKCVQPVLVSTCAKIHLKLGVEQMNGLHGLTVSPNPANGAFNISARVKPNETVRMEIVNAYGQLVHSEVFTTASENLDRHIDTKGQLADGIYTLRITTGQGSSSTKLVLQNN